MEAEPTNAAAAAPGVVEPKGLSMSLDSMISSNRGAGKGGQTSTRGGHGGRQQQQQQQRNPDALLNMSLDDLVGKSKKHGSNGQQGGAGGKWRGPRGGAGGVGRGRGDRSQFFDPNHNNPLPDMRAYLKKDGSGDVVVRFKSNEIVTINSQGDVTLARNNYTNTITLRAMQKALEPIGMTVKAVDKEAGEWTVTDGRSLLRFMDGVVVPAKGRGAGRGQAVLHAFTDPNARAANAATAASNAAAAALGISVSALGAPGSLYPVGGGPSFQGGLGHPPFNRGRGYGRGSGRGYGRGRGRGRGGGGFRGEHASDDADGDVVMGDAERRQRAKGRYHPY